MEMLSKLMVGESISFMSGKVTLAGDPGDYVGLCGEVVDPICSLH